MNVKKGIFDLGTTKITPWNSRCDPMLRDRPYDGFVKLISELEHVRWRQTPISELWSAWPRGQVNQ